MNTVEQLLPGPTLPGLPLIPPPGQSEYDPALPTPQFLPPTPPKVEVPKVVREYPLPGARQTHEMALLVGTNMLVVSQQTNSTLIKVELDRTTGRPQSCNLFVVYDIWAGLHGLAASHVYPGHVWATLQFRSLLIRINVALNKIETVIHLPQPVFGPHCIYEVGKTDLWTSCKDSRHVVRVNHTDPVNDISFYPCSSRPIFIATHPKSGDVYASLDLGSKIWRLEKSTGNTSELDIPPDRGSTPVGLIAGPDGNIWFTLLGGRSGGTGTFARISATGEFNWFSLSTPLGANAGLIHLAFLDHPALQQIRGRGSGLRLWLLSSSMVSDAGTDAIVTVVIDDKVERIVTEHTIAFPSQLCRAHRVLLYRTGLFVTQLAISSLAHVAGAATLKPAVSAGESIDVTGETTDVYSDFGLGQRLQAYSFSEDDISLPWPPFPPPPTITKSTTPQAKGARGFIR